MDANNLRQRSSLKGRLKVALIGRRLIDTQKAFDEYARYAYPTVTEPYHNHDELRDANFNYDCLLCGSDQIWNPSHVHYDKSWMFDFVDKPETRVVSYAASIGKDILDGKDLEWLSTGIKKFHKVGVREDSAIDIVCSLGGHATQCLDPTLLIKAEEWRAQGRRTEINLPEKYIFYYPIEKNAIETKLLFELKKMTGIPCVAFTNSFRKPPCADIQITGFGPREFLYALDNSAVVFTNSFHGLAFSLQFEKLLVSYKNEKKNSRLESMFRLLGLDNYQVSSIEDLQGRDLKFDHHRLVSSLSRIENERQKSLEYLSSAIDG